jgi:hypothetical protein
MQEMQILAILWFKMNDKTAIRVHCGVHWFNANENVVIFK